MWLLQRVCSELHISDLTALIDNAAREPACRALVTARELDAERVRGPPQPAGIGDRQQDADMVPVQSAAQPPRRPATRA